MLFEISIVCHVLCSWLVGGWFFWLPAVLCLAFFSVISLVVEGVGCVAWPSFCWGVGCCLALLLGLGVFCLACLLFDVCCWGGGGLGVSCLASFCGGLGVGWGLFSICLAAAFWLWFCLESLILAQDERWRRA